MNKFHIARFHRLVITKLMQSRSDAYKITDPAGWTELMSKSVGKAIEHPNLGLGARAVHRWRPDPWGNCEHDRRASPATLRNSTGPILS